VALEAVWLLCLAAVGCFAAVRGAEALGPLFFGDGSQFSLLPPHGDLPRPPSAFVDRTAPEMFLGMSDELLLDRVQNQDIVATKLNRGGSSLSFRLDLADGSRAAFKPAQTNLQTIPRKEIAAYRIARLLGLHAVPPAAPRRVSRKELLDNLHPKSQPDLPRILSETIFDRAGKTAGMVQYWIPRIVDSGLDTPEGLARTRRWLTIGNPVPREDWDMAAQVSSNIVFDFIIANPDRHSGGNMKMSPDGSLLYYMDNTMAFFLSHQGPPGNRSQLAGTQRFSNGLFDALGRITEEGLREALGRSAPAGEILTPAEIRAVVARRRFVAQHISRLVSTHGRDEVLVFP